MKVLILYKSCRKEQQDHGGLKVGKKSKKVLDKENQT